MYQNNTQPHVTIPIKMPKFHWLTFWPNLVGARPCPVPGVGQMHLEVPWESLFGPKLKIHVKTIYCEHFVFYGKNNFVSHFSDFVYWKLPIFWRFWPKPVFVQIMKRYRQKLSKNLSQMQFQTFFINNFF